MVAKVNKVCYYVLARNRIALTQDFYHGSGVLFTFVTHSAIIALTNATVNCKSDNERNFVTLHKMQEC